MTVQVVARPRSLFRFEYDIEIDGVSRGVVQHRAFGRPGTMALDGVDYYVYPKGPTAWTAEIQGVPGEVAGASRVGAMKGNLEVSWKGGSIGLRRAAWGTRTDLVDGVETVGRIRPRDFMTRTLLGDMPDDLPIPVVGLCVWTIVRMRRQAVASSN